MDALALNISFVVVAALIFSLPYARRWAKKRQSEKEPGGDYAVPVPTAINQLSVWSMVVSFLAMAAIAGAVMDLVPWSFLPVAFPALVCGLAGAAAAQVLIGQRKKILSQTSSTLESISGSPQELVITVPALATLNRIELIVSAGLGALSMLLFYGLAAFLTLNRFTHFDPALSLIEKLVPVALVFLTLGAFEAFSLIHFAKARKEKQLLEKSKGRHFVLSEWGIECSTLLLEGERRRKLVETSQPLFKSAWSSLAEWNLEGSQRRSGKTTPEYHKLVFRDHSPPAFIRRRELRLREREILDFARNHVRNVTLKDAVYRAA